jgi:CheY-like chemotaxis protein
VSGKHHVLVIEDDKPNAEEVRHLMAAEGFRVTIVDNARSAAAAIGKGGFCLVLLDLDIKEQPRSISGHTTHGLGLVRTIRSAYPGRREESRRAGAPWLPLVVVSGRVDKVNLAVELMKDADDVVEKLDGRAGILKAVRNSLADAGLMDHQHCSAIAATSKASTVELSIPGNVTGRRARVRLGSHEADVPESSLLILLRLMVGRLEQRRVHKAELGADAKEAGFKGISRLKTDIGPAVIKKLKPIRNDQKGSYWLDHSITIGACGSVELSRLGNARIDEAAARIQALLGSDGKPP